MRLRNKKTGGVFDAVVREKSNDNGEYSIIVCNIRAIRNRESSFLGEYDSLAGLNEDWEDYKPAEPLIKDERIRKAVRAWYELFDKNRLGQFEDGKYIAVGYREFVLQTLDTSLTYTFELPFIDEMQSLKQRWGLGADYYTITELCGEE